MVNKKQLLKELKVNTVALQFDDMKISICTNSSEKAGVRLPMVKNSLFNNAYVVYDIDSQDWLCFDPDRVTRWNVVL